MLDAKHYVYFHQSRLIIVVIARTNSILAVIIEHALQIVHRPSLNARQQRNVYHSVSKPLMINLLFYKFKIKQNNIFQFGDVIHKMTVVTIQMNLHPAENSNVSQASFNAPTENVSIQFIFAMVNQIVTRMKVIAINLFVSKHNSNAVHQPIEVHFV